MSIEDQKPPDSSEQGSDEPTRIINRSGDATSASESPTSPVEPEQSGPSTSRTSDAPVVGKSASADTVPEQKPAPSKSIHDQDTVVSPRLRQLAQTPSQPLLDNWLASRHLGCIC
jgi:hypothetical protein